MGPFLEEKKSRDLFFLKIDAEIQVKRISKTPPILVCNMIDKW